MGLIDVVRIVGVVPNDDLAQHETDSLHRQRWCGDVLV